jgi:hypothetical protein
MDLLATANCNSLSLPPSQQMLNVWFKEKDSIHDVEGNPLCLCKVPGMCLYCCLTQTLISECLIQAALVQVDNSLKDTNGQSYYHCHRLACGYKSMCVH